MKPVSLMVALALTAFGSALAQNDTADATAGDVGSGNGNGNGNGDGNGKGKGGQRHGGHGGGEGGRKGHHHKHGGKHGKNANAGSTLERCTMLQHMHHVIDIAANATKLQQDFHGNATRIARFQDEAVQLQNTTSFQGALFQNLTNNATFLSICDAIYATESSDAACKQLLHLEGRAAIVANATALQKASHGNSTRAQQLQDQTTKAQPELAALQGNATLQQFCAGFQTRAQCGVIAQLEADVNLARNATRLNQTLDGNTTRITAFQNQVAKASARLDKLLNNATLVSICKTEMPFILDLGRSSLTPLGGLVLLSFSCFPVR